MSEYYLYDGREQTGPFSIEELKVRNILPQTMVWTESMTQWDEAKNIPELKPLFLMPPPIPKISTSINERLAGQNFSQPPAQQDYSHNIEKSNYLIWYIVIGIVAIVIVTILLFKALSSPETSSSSTNGTQIPSYNVPQSAVEPVRLSPEEQAKVNEKETPKNYISINATIESNLLIQPVIKGSVFNNATYTTYRDVQLRVTYRSNSGALIGYDYISVDYLRPQSMEEIRHKPSKKAYRKADQYSIDLYKAYGSN